MLQRRPRSLAGLRRAFTLVELLVVVSIIALLIAILLPSLKRARESAKRIKCTSNCRGIAQASMLYATEDKKEFTIPNGIADAGYSTSFYGYYGFGGKSGRGDGDVMGAPSVLTSEWAGPNFMGSTHRPLNKLIYKGGTVGKVNLGLAGESWQQDSEQDLEMFRCPGDKGFSGMHMKGWKESGLSSYDHYGTSYVASIYLVSSSGVNQPVDSNSMYYRPLSQVPNPTNTIMYMENGGRYACYADNPEEYHQPAGQCFWPYAYGKMTAKGFHGQDFHFNAAFGDGHAKWIKIKGHGLVPGVGKMPAQCPGSTCSCIILRGIEWQIDTLPAPLLDTPKVRGGDISGHTDGMSGDSGGPGSGASGGNDPYKVVY